MFKILPRITAVPKRNIPAKTVTIIHKNGRDVIKDEFIGFHVHRPSLLEILNDIFEDLFSLQK